MLHTKFHYIWSSSKGQVKIDFQGNRAMAVIQDFDQNDLSHSIDLLLIQNLHTSSTILANFDSLVAPMLHAKFHKNWPSAFRGDVVYSWLTDRFRMTRLVHSELISCEPKRVTGMQIYIQLAVHRHYAMIVCQCEPLLNTAVNLTLNTAVNLTFKLSISIT